MVYSTAEPLRFARGVDGARLTAAMLRCVEGVRDWALGHRYLIGHIKVFVENGLEGHLWLASTGKQIRVQPSEGWDTASSETFQVNFTAILFGVDQEHLNQVVADHLHRELNAIHP